jgi:hypothetical protein|tara:strand:+ start:279 stop:482 length:204 start_codon:yes stop_codon:yes gene_type:complete
LSVELSLEDRLRIDAAALLKKKANKVASSAPAKAVVAHAAPNSAVDAMMTETEKAQLVGVDMDQMMA